MIVSSIKVAKPGAQVYPVLDLPTLNQIIANAKNQKAVVNVQKKIAALGSENIEIGIYHNSAKTFLTSPKSYLTSEQIRNHYLGTFASFKNKNGGNTKAVEVQLSKETLNIDPEVVERITPEIFKKAEELLV